METENLDIKSILEDLGYKLYESGPDFWMTKSLDRGNHKGLNLSISKKNGIVFNFSGGDKYSIEEFVKLNNGEIDPNKLESFKAIEYTEELKLPKSFDLSILNSLIKDHSYWVGRAISADVLKEFQGGLANPEIMPKLAGRYILPILSEKSILEGFSARYTGSNPNAKKQKILGVKSNFVFPLYLNRQDILNSQVLYLVEGAGDLLTLFTCGIRNCLATFGLTLSKKLLSAIISLNPARIIICENFDENNAGQKGAAKIKSQLLNFFDESSVIIKNPAPYNDLNEMLTSAGPDKVLEYYRE